jgi:prepilin-type N-terminal cleavage/methylation domain-containing protein
MHTHVRASARPRPRRRRGFTLIELLVVVSIIVLLLSLLLPALASTRAHFKTVACSNNLRQLGNASNEYRLDDKQHIGLVSFKEDGSVDRHNDELRPLSLYTGEGSFGLYICPATTRYIEPENIDLLSDSPNDTEGEGKSYESYGAFQNNVFKTVSTTRGIESKTWLIFDTDNPGANHDMSDDDNHGPSGGNVLYADYHVEFVPGLGWEGFRLAGQLPPPP